MSTVKIDAGKPPMSLMPVQALQAVAVVMQRNQKPVGKYDRYSIREGGSWSSLLDASFRHLGEFQERHDLDQDDGLLALAHAACDVLALLDWQIRGVGTDDRVTLEPEEPF